MNMADKNKLGYVGKLPDRDSNSWFTPSKYIEEARWVMGGIDFDPFSSRDADLVVKAGQFYTEADDALVKPWPNVDTVWCNPPYGRGICSDAVKSVVENYGKTFRKGIVLTNNATDTKWWNELASVASMICFTDHRIAFTNTDGKNVSGNTRGQCFFLLSSEPTTQVRFSHIFSAFGKVLKV